MHSDDPDRNKMHANGGSGKIGVEYVLLTGVIDRFNPAGYWREISSSFMSLLIFGFAVVMTAFNPSSFENHSAILLIFSFWITISYLFFSTYFVFKCLAEYVCPLIGIKRIYRPVSSALVIILMLPIANLFAESFNGRPLILSASGIKEFICYYFLEQFLATIYYTYKPSQECASSHKLKAERLLQEIRDAESAESPNPVVVKEIFIGGKQLFLDQLFYMSSNGHYLKVATKDGDKMLRARIRDAFHAINSNDCFFVHKSHCVMREGILSYDATGPKIVLTMKDSNFLGVADAKKTAFLKWYSGDNHTL